MLFKRIKYFFTKIRDYVALSSANFASTIGNAVFWMFFAILLTTEEYGELGYVFGIVYVGYAFGSLGIERLIVVYGVKNKEILQPAYALTIISSITVPVISYLITQDLGISLLIFSAIIWMPYVAEINSRKKYLSYAKAIILYRIFFLSFSFILYFIIGFEGILIGAALAAFMSFKWIIRFIKNKKISITTLRSKSHFMIFSYVSLITITFFFWGDKIVIGPVFGFEVLGYYTFASHYAYLLNSIPLSLMVYLLPQEAQNIQNKKLKKYAVIFSAILILILILLAPHIVNNFFPKFNESIPSMQVMTLGILPWIVSTIFESTFLGKGKSIYVLYATGSLTGSYLVLLIILGFEFGLIGLSFAFLISSIIRAIVSLVLYKKFLN